MVTYLIKRFIPDWQNTSDPVVRTKYGSLSGIVGICFNLLLFLGKILMGLLSGSIAVIADAFNNLSDAGSSIVTLIGFRMAGQKADRDHPFGHGRIEYLTGLFISLAIIVVGLQLAQSSVDKILHPAETTVSAPMILMLVLAILVKFYMFLYNRKMAGMIGSVALESTAQDSRNDVLTTSVVLLSLLFTQITGISIDAYTGLAVALFILYSGARSALDTINPLLGQEPDPELVRKIYTSASAHDGILGIHDLVIHDYGPGRRMMSLHAEVPASMSLVDAHTLIDQIEHALKQEFGIETVIHMDPVDQEDPEAAALEDKLSAFLQDLCPDYTYHDFRIVHSADRTKVIFDINLPWKKERSDDEIVEQLQTFFQKLDARYIPVINVDHYRKNI